MNFQRDLSLLFKRREGIYIRLPLKTREEKRERKRKRVVISSFLSLCVCACVFILLRKEEFCLSVRIVCVSLDVCFFEAKRGGRKKTRDSCLCVFEFFSFFSPLLLLQKFDTKIFSLLLWLLFLKNIRRRRRRKKEEKEASINSSASCLLYAHVKKERSEKEQNREKSDTNDRRDNE
jgi:hypothetical protein